MCNNFKSNQNEEIKSEGILIFKDTMEYLIDGILTAEQYAELTRMIYATRWGNGVNEKEIKDKLLLGIWKTLKHTIKKSARNARYRENNQNKKSALQEVTSTEFDLPKEENQNTADLSHQNIQDDISIHQEQDIQPESLKIALNEKIEDNNIEDNKDMGNLTNIVYDSTTGRFQFTNKQKEDIKNKMIKVAASKQSSNTELTDEEKYGSDVMDFVEDYDIVLKALRADIDYRKFGEKDKELLANTANDKIKDAIVQNGNTTPDFISKLQEFFKNYQLNYYKDKLNNYETDI